MGNSGLPFGSKGGITLNSRIDPVKEAESFIRQSIPGPAGTIILLGASLSYLAEALEREHPHARKILVYYTENLVPRNFQEPDYAGSGNLLWFPGSGVSPAEFFASTLTELDLEGLRTAEWAPCRKAYPEVSGACNAALLSVVQRLSGSALTVSSFGKLWMRNSLQNFIRIENFSACRTEDRPTVIAASGPSLTGFFAEAKVFRHRINLWALPSSLHALISENIIPDLVISTDPGFWAFEHLKILKSYPKIPVLMPLSGAPGLWRTASPACIFSQNMFLEKIIFRESGMKVSAVPQNGSVAGTALQAASMTIRSPIIFAGLDLMPHAGLAHVHPHTFDFLFYGTQNRLRPSSSAYFGYYQKTLPSFERALSTYARWFGSLEGRKSDNLFRFLPSGVSLPGFRNLDRSSFAALIKDAPGMAPEPKSSDHDPHFSNAGFPDKPGRGFIVRNILDSIITRCLEKERGLNTASDLAEILNDGLLLELLFYSDFISLKNVKKMVLEGSTSSALEILRTLLRSTADFLLRIFPKEERHYG